MIADRALEILAALESHGVRASIDGGWGVDALVAFMKDFERNAG